MSSSVIASVAPPNSGFEPADYVEARTAAVEYMRSNGYLDSSFVEQRVAWNDMDSLSHVNNTRYLVWLESSRVATTAVLKMGWGGKGLGFILASMDGLKWLRPVVFPDTCLVAHKASMKDERSLEMEGVVYSFKQRRPVVVCKAKLVAYDYDKLEASTFSPERVAQINALMRGEVLASKL